MNLNLLESFDNNHSYLRSISAIHVQWRSEHIVLYLLLIDSSFSLLAQTVTVTSYVCNKWCACFSMTFYGFWLISWTIHFKEPLNVNQICLLIQHHQTLLYCLHLVWRTLDRFLNQFSQLLWFIMFLLHCIILRICHLRNQGKPQWNLHSSEVKHLIVLIDLHNSTKLCRFIAPS